MRHNGEVSPKGEIVLYKSKDGQVNLEVGLKQDTVWLNLNQMVALFGRDKSVISRHLHNIFKTKELYRNSVVAKFATTAANGNLSPITLIILPQAVKVKPAF